MASSTCPNCQAVLDAGTAECPSCGSPQSGVSPSAASGPVGPPPAPGPVGSPGAPAPSAKSQVKFDITLLSHTDRIVGIASLVLFIDLFLNWYSASVGAFGGGSANALTAHGYLYITLILTLVIVALLSAEALSLLKVPATSPVSRDQFLLVATVINLVLVLIAFLFKPAGFGVVTVSRSYGTYVGLIAAVVAAFPLGWPVIQAKRAKK
jgi:hypothetical protein